MEEYKVSDYAIFDNAINTTSKFNEAVKSIQDKVNTCKTKLADESVFMGPICDSCVQASTSLDSLLTVSMANFSTISDYLKAAAEAYKNGDSAAMTKVLTLDKEGKLKIVEGGENGVTADGVAVVTIDQVQNCQNVQEYLDLVMPIYSFYAKKYGIKYPGVLALQPVHEHSAPTGIHAQSAVEDNNLGGLKYGDSIPNATPGSYPSDGTGGQYSHFNNITEYVEAACWNIAKGDYYHDAMAQNSMEGFATTMIDTWVGHPDNYGSSVVEEYKKYGLDKYEI